MIEVVASTAFKEHFLRTEDGDIPDHRVTNVSGNVVSVLQAGAFFGALGSAPVSCEFTIHFSGIHREALNLIDSSCPLVLLDNSFNRQKAHFNLVYRYICSWRGKSITVLLRLHFLLIF